VRPLVTSPSVTQHTTIDVMITDGIAKSMYIVEYHALHSSQYTLSH